MILRRILNRGGLQTHKSSAVRNLAIYYASCLDQKIIESKKAKPLQDLIKLVGSWTVTNTAWNPEGWNFGQALTQIHKLKSMPLFYMFVGPDDKDSSRNIIQVNVIPARDAFKYTLKQLTAFTSFSQAREDIE